MERLFHIEEVLAYIEEQKKENPSPTRHLSMYYEATQKNLEPNEKTYSLWEGYIETLEKNGYGDTEIREVYKMLKSKFWRFLKYWQGWFNYESNLPIERSKRAKVLEFANDILQYKECAEKGRILAWIREKSVGSYSRQSIGSHPMNLNTVVYTRHHMEMPQNSSLYSNNSMNTAQQTEYEQILVNNSNQQSAMYTNTGPVYSYGPDSSREQPAMSGHLGGADIGMDIEIESSRGESECIRYSVSVQENKYMEDMNISARENIDRNNPSNRMNEVYTGAVDYYGVNAHENNLNKQTGTITRTGDVFDLEIGTEVTETRENKGLAEKEKNKTGELADKYFLSAPKKITLNGRRLRILRTIGKGGSAKVYQVLSDKNEVFALKKIKISQESEDSEVYKSYVNEISLLKRLRNRHEIVTLKDSYVNKERIAILMEYGDIDLCRFLEIEKNKFPGGYRKSNENCTMISLWEQMLRAVKCIHEHRIVHRDLKPGNFLFVNGRLKLIDFGISKEIRNDTTNIIREKQIGTINYMSPEAIIEGKTKMGRNSDIWSLGCILYEMYFGESPFMRFKNLVQRMQKLLDPEYVVELPIEEENDNGYLAVSEEIRKCLVREPKERAKIDVLLRTGISSGAPFKDRLKEKETHSFTKPELKEFISKILDLRHTATTEKGHEKIIEKIINVYFNQ